MTDESKTTDTEFTTFESVICYADTMYDTPLWKFLDTCVKHQLDGHERLLHRLHPEYLTKVINFHLQPFKYTTEDIQETLVNCYRDDEESERREQEAGNSIYSCMLCHELIPEDELFCWCTWCTYKCRAHVRCLSESLITDNRCPNHKCLSLMWMIGCQPHVAASGDPSILEEIYHAHDDSIQENGARPFEVPDIGNEDTNEPSRSYCCRYHASSDSDSENERASEGGGEGEDEDEDV